jgi:hypothetical protein
MAERDQFDLINAKKDYMDFNVGEGEKNDVQEMEELFAN